MKKTLMALVLAAGTAFTSSASYAEVFNGFYTGAAIGYQRNNNKLSGETFNYNSIPANIFVGFVASQPQSFLWGFEGGFGYNFKCGKKTYEFINSDGNKVNVTVQENRKFFAELMGKLGWNFECFTTYGILGVGVTQTEVKIKAVEPTGTASVKKSDYVFSFFPGIGTSVKLTDCLSARIEYKYHIEQSVGGLADKELSSLRKRTHDIRVGVEYAL